jgi:hypothetical protein
MKYLKTYKSINESTLGELSFEDFKDILIDIVDEYSESHEFIEYSEEQEDSYFGLYMNIQSKYMEYNFDILGELKDFGDHDDPQTLDHTNYVDIIDRIEDNRSDLQEIKDKIDECISFNKKMNSLIDELNSYIFPKLNSFSNCEDVRIGFDSEGIIIEFDIK